VRLHEALRLELSDPLHCTFFRQIVLVVLVTHEATEEEFDRIGMIEGWYERMDVYQNEIYTKMETTQSLEKTALAIATRNSFL
jgi:hypothetical protein